MSAAGWSLYCVWQFIFSPGGIDLRLLLLAIEYLPFALGLTWCCEAGGSVWTAAACHAVFNAVFLIRAIRL